MPQCKLPNLGILDEIGVPAEILELQNFDEMFYALMDFFSKDTNHSKSEEESLSPEKFKQSIDLKIKKLLDLADAAAKNNPTLDLKKGGKHSEMLKSNLEMELYPKGNITREEEIDLSAVIDGQLASRELIEAQRLNKLLDTFYANNLPAREYFKTHFTRELGLTTVIRIGQTLKDSSIVDSQKALNKNIMKFMGDQYLTVYRYLNKLGLAKGLPNSMFRGNNCVGTYLNTLDRFYNLVVHKSKIGTLEDEIEQGWLNSISDEKSNQLILNSIINYVNNLPSINSNLLIELSEKFNLSELIEDYFDGKDNSTEALYKAINEFLSIKGNTKEKLINTIKSVYNKLLDSLNLFEAVNAYLSVVYFDKLSKEAIGDYISSDKNQDFPIETDEEGNVTYKYRFGKDTENRVHGWLIDVRDALKEMGNFSKFLISSIPIDDTYLTPVNYLGAFTNLFGKVQQLIGRNDKTTELYNAIVTFNLNPVNKFREILTIINSLDSVRNALLDGIVNPYEMKVFDAVYEYVFKGSNSLFGIEATYNKLNGLTNRYPLVESLAALIGSSTEMSYLQTIFDYNSNQYITTIKKKFQTNKLFFDMVRSINNSNQVMENIEIPYKFLTKSNTHYSIDFGNYTLEIKVTPELNPYGILTKWSETKGVEVSLKDKASGAETSIESLFKNKDISTKAKRLALIDSRSDDIFMKLLEFTDFFAGTSFTSNQDGLLEFDLFKNNFKDSPLEALITAVRGMVVRDIHSQFRNAVENGLYSSSLLDKFILDNKVFKDSILGIDPTDSEWKTVWEAGVLGPDLITISNALTWANDYVTIKLIMSGEISKANTKNLAGDSVPNYGLAFMGSDIHTIIKDAQHQRGIEDTYSALPLDTNLFMGNPKAIKGTVIDTDVRLADGTTKLVKSMTEGELFYHAIVDKFLIPLTYDDKYIIIQPTTYSDKTKFVNYMVSTIFNGKDLSLMSNSELESLYIDSIGKGYQTVLCNVLLDYALIFDLVPDLNKAYVFDEIGDIKSYNPAAIKLLTLKIDRLLNNYTEQELIALAKLKGVKSEILADTHFRYNKHRKRNGKQYLSFNESLYHYAMNVYTKQGIKQRLNDEKRKFLNQLLKNKISISGIGMFKGNPDPESLFTRALRKLDESPNYWIQRDGTLTLARVNDEAITTHNAFPEGTQVELNPILDKYFMLNSLLGNNLRMILTGSEINHKNKHLTEIKPNEVIRETLNSKNKSNLVQYQDANIKEAINKLAREKNIDPLEFWDSMSLLEAYELIDNITDVAIKNKVKKAIDKKMYEVEAFGQGAQLKRNVIIPATMRYYTQNSLRGIPRTMRLAIMDDIQADVFNFTGDDGTVDSHDGAAFINPITSILENWSLLENEVGTVKKPIWHYYDKQHMTASLVKFAAHTITNNMMLQSIGSRVNMLNMFKKMANKPWALLGNILLYAAHRPDGEITFQDLTGGNALYYKGPEGINYKIVDFGYEDGVYWTDEIRVNDKGIGSGPVRKYHYFDADSNHIISTKRLEGYHTMSSIYEAHQIFGGINSESLIGEGRDAKLQYSEASNYVVANLVNNVTILTEEGKNAAKKEFNLTHYAQPLKTLMIDYLCNNSAIKNGAGNRNSADRFYNNEALDTITLGTEYYGIQMDADHEADEAEMTEFSQVISALDAGGRLHEYVRGIYQALGLIALEESALEMEAISAYQLNPTEQTRDALYDIIGRTIINNISTARGQAGLAESIINQIKRRFNLTNNHSLDDLKIPFSDANIYSNILSTFASIITNKSIRKKYPGLGAVLSPGFNIMMVYDIDGRQYQYKDLVKEATIKYTLYKKRKKEGEPDEDDVYYEPIWKQDKDALEKGYSVSSEQWNKQVVDAFLMRKTNIYNSLKWKYKVKEIPGLNPNWDLHTEEFMPTDNVGILIEDSTGNQEWVDVSLDSISDYYLFKADPRAFILDKVGKPVKVLEFRKNLHKARNLAPTKIWWEYKAKTPMLLEDGTIKEVMVDRTNNIFNSIHMLKKFAESLKGEKQTRILNYISRLQAQGIKEYANTQLLLDELDGGTYNGVPIKLYNTPAELIMSNIYQSRFGVDVDLSLIDVIKDGPKKAGNTRQVHQSVNPDFYDMVMTKANGHHTYLSLDRHFESTVADEDGNLPDIQYRWTYWKDRHRKSVNDPLIVNEVYATNKELKVLFKIGRDIRRPDLAYSLEGKYYYDKNTHEKIENNRLLFINGEVVEYVEFVTKHEVRDHGRRHTVLNVNLPELKRTITPRDITLENGHTLTPEQAIDLDANTYILELFKEIYEADSYETLTVNNQQVKRSNLTRVQKILEGFGHKNKDGKYIYFGYDMHLTRYLEAISELFSKIPEAKEFKRPDLSYDSDTDTIKFIKLKDNGSIAKILNDRTVALKDRLNKKKYYSFLRSQFYTASRIPAQTLQSFMNMRLVGYTAEGSNLAYVSHWQTWLQGSDYDIDKAYIMGLAFDDNGQYIGWSSLFNYNSLETIQASEYLPLPKNGVIIEESENGIDISEEANIIKLAREVLDNSPEPALINEWGAKEVLAYARILNKLGDNKLVKGATPEIIEKLNNHNATRLPADLKAAALRNFISVHIQNTILNVRNAADSYIPVDINDLRDAAGNSPKGAEALEITLMNPLSIYTMLYQNMTGKNVIAISATGQKAAFMWMYYLNDTINKAREGIDYTVNALGEVVPVENTDFDYSRFKFTTSRIAGRSKEINNIPQMQLVTSTTLPDVNTEKLSNLNLINYIEAGKLHSGIPIDILISLMISAATDNAKELILAKINAGSKLAKCYLFLMTLGYDINDIVKFMTSDAISWIDSLSDPNVFLGQELRVDEALEELEKYLKNYEANKDVDHYEDEDGYEVSGSRNKLSLLKSIIPNDLTAQLRSEALADIQEFKNVLEGSDEFSSFGRLLSINQGLPGKAEDLMNTLLKIKNLITKREKDMGITNADGNLKEAVDSRYQDIAGGAFNPTRWLLDEEYQERVAEYYNKLKVTLNIFAIAPKIPHFKSMFTLLGGECTVNQFSVKSRILDACLNKIAKECPKLYLDDKYYSRILGFASSLMMQLFIVDGNFKFPIKGSILDNNRTIVSKTNGILTLDSEEGIASFKYYFENVVIPGLKAGTYGSWDDATKEEIRKNSFIQALARGSDRDVPIWKTNVNISSDSSYTRVQLSRFSKGLKQLSNYNIGNLSISDWFAIYNLIVNKNQYGSDRLTKIFEGFIKEFDSKGDNIINRYLKYVGEHDYSEAEINSIMDFTTMDLFISLARVVSSLKGLKDPVVIMYEDKLPVYYKNVGFNKYERMDDILPSLPGEGTELKLHRFYLDRAYFILGKPHSSIVARIKNLLDNSPIVGIAELMRLTKLFLDINCI